MKRQNQAQYIHFILVILVVFTSCSTADRSYDLVDPLANEHTQYLYGNMRALSGKGLMFGHQNTLSSGYYWTGSDHPDTPSRSDVKDVTGSYPAVYGWDLANFMQIGLNEDEKKIRREELLNYSREGFQRGGILSYSWHASNPLTKGSFYDTTRAVHTILPGGELHESYRQSLDEIAEFFLALDSIPAIFRPWHEHNGDWFWWGKGLCTEEDFVALWRFTVEYLRDEKKVHNLLYAYSPDRSRIDIEHFNRDYLYAYPGDEYVDIIGLDNYWDLGHPANTTPADQRKEFFIRSAENVVDLAEAKDKLPALTEGGLEAIPDSTFWTQTILDAILTNEKTKKVSYFAVWRNATYAIEQRDHYYAPYPGQVSSADFMKFREHPFVLFEDELPNMYISPSQNKTSNTYNAQDERIQVMGRYLKNQDSTLSFAASGVQVHFQFEGTALDVVLDDEFRNGDDYNWFSVSVNGEAPFTFRTIPGRKHYRLAGPLVPGVHEVVLTKQTEGQNGVNTLATVQSTRLLQAETLPDRRIEFIGDSITSGFGADSSVVPCATGKWYDQHSTDGSYAVLVSKSLHAQWMLSSISGAGMFRNWNSDAPTVPTVYDGVFMEYADSTSQWSFESYPSNLLVIALGTNDFSEGGGPQPRKKIDAEAFIKAYDTFLDRLRKNYPQAKMLLTTSPMMAPEQNDVLLSYVETIAVSQRSKGFTEIRTFRYRGRYNNGCNIHPSLSDHRLMAEELRPVIKEMMQW
jgi:mannan endo-1,4-beta-mannosidase